MRLIIHPGFHKTGTSSLQAFLRKNRKTLSPHAAVYLREDMGLLAHLGNHYGRLPIRTRRRAYRLGLRRFFAALPDHPQIVLSRESLFGMMLGRKRLFTRCHSYKGAAIPLAREIVSEAKARFGPDCQVEFLVTTRDGEAALRSAWAYMLRTQRMRQDYAPFRERFGAPPDLNAEAKAIAKALAPVPVHVAPLEQYGDSEFGMGQAILDRLELPKEVTTQLLPAAPANQSVDPAMQEQFLALNRSRLSGLFVQTRKDLLFRFGRTDQSIPAKRVVVCFDPAKRPPKAALSQAAAQLGLGPNARRIAPSMLKPAREAGRRTNRYLTPFQIRRFREIWRAVLASLPTAEVMSLTANDVLGEAAHRRNHSAAKLRDVMMAELRNAWPTAQIDAVTLPKPKEQKA